MNYAQMAKEYADKAEARQAEVVAFLTQLGRRYAGQLAAVEAEKMREFNDLVADRNRFVQWSIMYSNLAVLAGQQISPERTPTPRQRTS